MPMVNVDSQEVKKFSDIAKEWWNKDGDFKPLHIINPLRVNFIKEKTELKNKNILDVGCGGGLLTESLFDFGAKVIGIDAAGPGIEVAKLHAEQNKKNIDYYEKTAEELNEEKSESFDIVTCLEVLEHVPDPRSLVNTCVSLLKPGGLLFLSTINKNPRSWITAIIGAEYIFNILPKGTHEFDKFIKPSSLASFVRDANAEVIETKGMFYNPITHKAKLNNDLSVNYLMYARKL
tara:strand:+ start:3071 stop:3772 length:702 start_codon:yes stop_codon:yes gene_type:complete